MTKPDIIKRLHEHRCVDNNLGILLCAEAADLIEALWEVYKASTKGGWCPRCGSLEPHVPDCPVRRVEQLTQEDSGE